MAPWIFGAAGIAYAIIPASMSTRVGHWVLLYATVLTVCTLGTGVAVQPVAHRLDHPSEPRAMGAALVLVAAGVALAALAVGSASPWLGLVAAVVLGAGYGSALVSGLLELQRIVPPDKLAPLTGAYYALSYLGFLLPTAVAAVQPWVSTADALWALTGVVALCGVLVARGSP
jgi:hypothetical protein